MKVRCKLWATSKNVRMRPILFASHERRGVRTQEREAGPECGGGAQVLGAESVWQQLHTTWRYQSDSRPFNPVRLTRVSKCLNHGVILEWRIGKDLCGSFVVYGNIETVIVYYRDSVTRRGDGLTLDKYKNFVQHLSVRTKLLFGSYFINYSSCKLIEQHFVKKTLLL